MMENAEKSLRKKELQEHFLTYVIAWILGTGVMFLLFAVVAFGQKVTL